jgi:hypothetical protein
MGKTHSEAWPVVHSGEEAERFLAMFGAENHQRGFDWYKAYREGFVITPCSCASIRARGQSEHSLDRHVE